MQPYHIRSPCYPANRHEVTLRVERQVLLQHGDSPHVERAAKQQGVPVRGRPRDDLGTDHATRARAIVDDELLTGELRKLLKDYAGQEVRRAARRTGDDDTNGPDGIRLGGRIVAGDSQTDRKCRNDRTMQ